MGIYGALNTANSGMQAQAFALEQISGNIANSRTTAYKKTETTFQDFVPDAQPDQQISKGVTVSARSTNNVQGDLETSDVSTHMALNGAGYFVVEESAGSIDGRTVFDGSDRFTRRGDFERNEEGYLVNGGDYYLKGYPVDPVSGNVSGSRPEVISIPTDFLPARQTTEIDYRANVPTLPRTSSYSATTPGSELLNPASFGADPRVLTAPATGTPTTTATTNPSIAGQDREDFLDQSIAGNSLTAYDQLGNATNLQIRWAKVQGAQSAAAASQTSTDTGLTNATTLAAAGFANGNTFSVTVGGTNFNYAIPNAATQTIGDLITAINAGAVDATASLSPTGNLVVEADNTVGSLSFGGNFAALGYTAGPTAPTAATTDVWNMFYLENSNATGGQPMWRSTGVAYEFGADGKLAAPGINSVTVNGMTVDGNSLGDLTIDHGAGGVTQYASPYGTANITQLAQNGYSAGEVVSVNVTNEGRIRVAYTNGQTVDVAQVAVANFNAENRLKKLDGGGYEATAESGFPIYGSNTSIDGSSLEASNTDISEEFSKLIVTQQAYSANSRIISTSSDMLREAIDMVR